jgi:phage protein D
MAAYIAQLYGLVLKVQPFVGLETFAACEQNHEGDLVFLTRKAKEVGARVRVKRSGATGAIEVVSAGPQLGLTSPVLSRKDVEQWSAPLWVKTSSVFAMWYRPSSGLGGLARAGSGNPSIVLPEIYDSAAAARGACANRLKDLDRASAQLSLTLTTMNTSIMAGTPIALGGFRSEIDTIWNVVQVQHRVDANRARTSLVAERAV